jgi:hypothetical protein
MKIGTLRAVEARGVLFISMKIARLATRGQGRRPLSRICWPSRLGDCYLRRSTAGASPVSSGFRVLRFAPLNAIFPDRSAPWLMVLPLGAKTRVRVPPCSEDMAEQALEIEFIARQQIGRCQRR